MIRLSNGKYDAGQYCNGRLSGMGRLNLVNGDIYDGCFLNGNMSGLGIYYIT